MICCEVAHPVRAFKDEQVQLNTYIASILEMFQTSAMLLIFFVVYLRVCYLFAEPRLNNMNSGVPPILCMHAPRTRVPESGFL